MSIAVVEKTFSVMELLAESEEPVTLAHLAEGSLLPRPTAYRILQTLVSLGYAAQTETSSYYLTGKIESLAGNGRYRDLKLAALPAMERIYRKFNETVNLGVLHGTRVHYVHVLETTRPLRMMVQPNAVDQFYSTAIGRAIAAFLPEQERSAVVNAVDLRPATPQTVNSRADLARILDETRERGWAAESEETTVGVTCLGVPVLRDGYPLGAISITVPVSRLTPERRSEIINALCVEKVTP